MTINVKESIANCEKYLYRYTDGIKLRFDLIEDPEEREKATLLSEYLWILKETEKDAYVKTKVLITD